MKDTICPFGHKLDKYWQMRYDLFSKFDDGIQIDIEGLYSAKPEQISFEIGGLIEGEIILDAFGGVGASAIGFARQGKKVICVEIDKLRFEMIKNNIEVYGLTDNILLINEDIFKISDDLIYDSVYLDPPWGGPSYVNKDFFKLTDFDPNGELLLNSFKKAKQIALSVPLNFDFNEITKFGRNYYLNWGKLNNKKIFANLFISNNENLESNLI
jgi:trimethylguanosine synthase